MPDLAELNPRGVYRRIPWRPHQLTQLVTPSRHVFVLAHLGVPRVRARGWVLELDGLVGRAKSFTLAGLRRYPKRELACFFKCAGNPLEPLVPQRRIVNVVWGGVDLTTLLGEAEVSSGATHLWSYGVDYGEFGGTHGDAYVKDLPLWRVAAGDVLVAYDEAARTGGAGSATQRRPPRGARRRSTHPRRAGAVASGHDRAEKLHAGSRRVSQSPSAIEESPRE
ncbi:MAG: molybdopterin-dependent oxidoreductase [Streptosporangiaceae bacterium]